MLWIDRIGLFGLGLFALSSVWQTAPGHIGIALCLPSAFRSIWLWSQRVPASRTRPSSVTLATVAVALWLALRFILQTWFKIGESALADVPAVLVDWLAVLVFALLGALPCRDPVARVRLLWQLAMLGFILGAATFISDRGVASLWSGDRIGLHLNRPLGVGLYAGCFAIALIATSRHWWNGGSRYRWPLRLAGIASTALFLQVLVSAQNRSTYLAAACVLTLSLCFAVLKLFKRQDKASARSSLQIVGLAALLATAFALTNLGAITQRLNAERSTFDSIMAEGIDSAPISSSTVRLRLWMYALERFPEAPLLGQGFGSTQKVISRDLLAQVGLPYDHLHNTYIQTLWSQGLIGLAAWATLFVVLIRGVHVSAQADPERRALLPAMWGILVFGGIWAIFDYRLSHPDMRFFAILCLLSLQLLGQGPTSTDNAPRA